MIGPWPEGAVESLALAVLLLLVLTTSLAAGLSLSASRRRRRARALLATARRPTTYDGRPDRLVMRPDGHLVIERDGRPDLVSVRPVPLGVLVRVDVGEGRLTLPEVETREVDDR